MQVPGYGLRSYRMGSTTCDSPPCPLIVAVHSWMATSDSAVATYNLDAHLPAYGGAQATQERFAPCPLSVLFGGWWIERRSCPAGPIPSVALDRIA